MKPVTCEEKQCFLTVLGLLALGQPHLSLGFPDFLD